MAVRRTNTTDSIFGAWLVFTVTSWPRVTSTAPAGMFLITGRSFRKT